MREPLKSMIEDVKNNKYQGLHFDGFSLFAYCHNDCNKKINYEIKQRNIRSGKFYCRICSQKHKTFTQESLNNIVKGAKLRSGKGQCSKYGKNVENRNSAGLCNLCIFNLKENKKAGICSICGEKSQTRDQNDRGIDYGCSQKWYKEHNSSNKMIKISIKNLKNNIRFNFIKKYNIEYVLNPKTLEYEEKDSYFEEFKSSLTSEMLQDYKIQKLLSYGFNLEPIIDFDPYKKLGQNLKQTNILLIRGYNLIVYVKLFKGSPFIIGKNRN